MGKYDCYLVLSLKPENSTELLREKCAQKGVPTHLIQFKFDEKKQLMPLSESDLQILQSLNGKCCIYIHGDGDIGLNILSASPRSTEKHITAQQLARIMANHLNHEKIEKVEIKLIACHGAASTSSLFPDSFADDFFRYLVLLGMKKVGIVASTDMMTAKQHPTTKKVLTLLETDREAEIRKKFTERRHSLLAKVKVDAFWKPKSPIEGLPREEKDKIVSYLSNYLPPEMLLDFESIDDFTAKLYNFLIKGLHPRQPTIDYINRLIPYLHLLNKELKSDISTLLGSELTEYAQAIKKENRARETSKKRYFFDGTNVEIDPLHQKTKKKLRDAETPKFYFLKSPSSCKPDTKATQRKSLMFERR